MELREPHLRRSLLADVALRQHKIRYCVSIDSSVAPSFDLESIQTQTLAALQAWINPVQQVRLAGVVNLRAVGCNVNQLHLQIVIGPLPLQSQVSVLSSTANRNGHDFALIHINTEYRSEKQTAIVDFKKVMRLESREELVSVLDRLALVQGFSTADFAKHSGLETEPVFWSTFRILLHEVGHAFGLCDASEMGLGCDPQYRTNVGSQTVMSDSQFVSLTRDDETGIAELFKRLKGTSLHQPQMDDEPR